MKGISGRVDARGGLRDPDIGVDEIDPRVLPDPPGVGHGREAIGHHGTLV